MVDVDCLAATSVAWDAPIEGRDDVDRLPEQTLLNGGNRCRGAPLVPG